MQTVRLVGLQALFIIVLVNSVHGKSIIEFLNLDDAAKLKFIKMAATCLAEHNPSDKLIDDLTNLKFTDDRNVKCYVHCLMSGFGIFNDGSSDFELAKVKDIAFEKDRPQAQTCAAEAKTNASDKCDIVFNFYKCLQLYFHK